MAYDFIAGSTFNYSGSLQLVGPTVAGTSGVNGNQPDFSQVTVTAAVYDQSGETLISPITVLNLAMPSNPETNGLFELNVSADTTATWPLGKVQIAMQIIMQDGTKILSNPIWFRIKASPIVQGGKQ